MDADTWSIFVKAAGELTLTAFLFANWWMERTERIKAQTEHKVHLEKDIEELLDQTEQMRRGNGGSGL